MGRWRQTLWGMVAYILGKAVEGIHGGAR
jgi:hypothetical protein